MSENDIPEGLREKARAAFHRGRSPEPATLAPLASEEVHYDAAGEVVGRTLAFAVSGWSVQLELRCVETGYDAWLTVLEPRGVSVVAQPQDGRAAGPEVPVGLGGTAALGVLPPGPFSVTCTAADGHDTAPRIETEWVTLPARTG
jgi:hypothetical protein